MRFYTNHRFFAFFYTLKCPDRNRQKAITHFTQGQFV
jgi:hypothetical protein